MGHEKFTNFMESCVVESAHFIFACSDEDERRLLRSCIKLNQACAICCSLVLKAISTKSKFTKQMCSLCAEILTSCAIACEQYAHIEHCKQSASRCRQSAAECLDYLSTLNESYAHINHLQHEQYEQF